MGLSSKLVSSDGLDFDWRRNQSLLQDAAVIEDMTSRSALGKREPPPDQSPSRSEPLKCPRCESTNTKFCYYNNYNKSQPRHFCKSCKRHWTKGGTLRNIPVGGSRKNKRLKTAPAVASIATMPVVANSKYSKPDIDHDQTFIGSKVISDNIPSMPHQDVLSLVQFPVSSMSDSVITSIMPTSMCAVPNLPMMWQAGIGQDAAPSFWSWEDIESLVSTNQGLAWDDSKVQLP